MHAEGELKEEYTQAEVAELVAIASHIETRPEEMRELMRKGGG